MKAALLAIVWSVAFYFVGLFGCLWILPSVSSNHHDASVEAAMTGAFFFGPLLAIVAFIAGFLFHRSRKNPPRED